MVSVEIKQHWNVNNHHYFSRSQLKWDVLVNQQKQVIMSVCLQVNEKPFDVVAFYQGWTFRNEITDLYDYEQFPKLHQQKWSKTASKYGTRSSLLPSNKKVTLTQEWRLRLHNRHQKARLLGWIEGESPTCRHQQKRRRGRFFLTFVSHDTRKPNNRKQDRRVGEWCA